MRIDERSQALANRIQDHLHAEGFSDDLLYVHTAVVSDGSVLVSLFPYAYDCEACAGKGFSPRLADAFRQRIRPTWCAECMSVTDQRWSRKQELTPRLGMALEQVFTVVEVSPDSPFTSFLVFA